MSPLPGRTLRFAASLTAATLLIGREAFATTTICSEAETKLYSYGTKATMKVDMRQLGPDFMIEKLKAYAAQKRLLYSSVEGFDPYKKPPYKSLIQGLQSRSGDVEIGVKTDNRSGIAHIYISTFSYSCSATEDWRSYWRDFNAFMATSPYRRIPEKDTALHP